MLLTPLITLAGCASSQSRRTQESVSGISSVVTDVDTSAWSNLGTIGVLAIAASVFLLFMGNKKIGGSLLGASITLVIISQIMTAYSWLFVSVSALIGLVGLGVAGYRLVRWLLGYDVCDLSEKLINKDNDIDTNENE